MTYYRFFFLISSSPISLHLPLLLSSPFYVPLFCYIIFRFFHSWGLGKYVRTEILDMSVQTSLFLDNIVTNWVQAGKNCIFDELDRRYEKKTGAFFEGDFVECSTTFYDIENCENQFICSEWTFIRDVSKRLSYLSPYSCESVSIIQGLKVITLRVCSINWFFVWKI